MGHEIVLKHSDCFLLSTVISKAVCAHALIKSNKHIIAMLSGPTAHSCQRKKNMRRIKMLAQAYDHNGGSKYIIKHIANCTNFV